MQQKRAVHNFLLKWDVFDEQGNAWIQKFACFADYYVGKNVQIFLNNKMVQ